MRRQRARDRTERTDGAAAYALGDIDLFPRIHLLLTHRTHRCELLLVSYDLARSALTVHSDPERLKAMLSGVRL